MGTGILQDFALIGESYTGHCAPCDKNHTAFTHKKSAKVAIASARMRLLHFENTFGEAHASEYCLAAMLCHVLIMVRSSRPDVNKLARLIGTADAAYPAKDKLIPDNTTVAPVRRAG